MLTYTTLDGDILDLGALGPGEREHFARAIAAYRSGMDWSIFMNDLVDGEANPLIEPGRRITRGTLESPLYRALLDLGNRLGIQQGRFKPATGDDVDTDPTADEAIPVAEAAEVAGVSLKAVYLAIERGDLISTNERPARVSRRSLQHYQVSRRHVKAGRSRSPIDATKVRDRDVTEFQRLLDATVDRTYSFAARLLGFGDEAEDAVQDVYLQAWQNAQDLPDSLSPESWILAQAGAVLQGLLRSQGKLAVDPIAPYLEMLKQASNSDERETPGPDPKRRKRIRESILASVA